ncbi:unnamed protein product [Strongylus vulgaris]|uniref:Uncharacterized protein n=1 Tax=Strongylus vulgaris TaxID=40348 RepID=A0A3P7LJJ6_STRVU|nr:unnamed protein product [Strongylus vulgaris]
MHLHYVYGKVQLGPNGEFVEYEKLLELLYANLHEKDFNSTIPELIVSAVEEDVGISFRPSTGQENRERTRAQYQVMTEIEVVLMRNPDLTLDRLKVATTKKYQVMTEIEVVLMRNPDLTLDRLKVATTKKVHLILIYSYKF